MLTKLPLDIVEASDLVCEGPLESAEVRIELEYIRRSVLGCNSLSTCIGSLTYVSELHQTQLSQRVDDFSPDLIGDVQLHHAHLRRAEHGVLSGSHVVGCREASQMDQDGTGE